MKLSNHKAELAAIFEPRDRFVIDIGCGDGAMLRHLARNGAHGIGIELEEARLAAARATPPAGGEAYLAASGDDVPLPTASADVVLYFNSFHHLPFAAMNRALSEAARLLAPDGLLVVVEPLAEGPYFAVLRPLEDETAARAAALACLDVPPASLTAELRRFYRTALPVSGFDALLARAVAADPARQSRVAEVEAEMRRLFVDQARPTEGGFTLDQPMRLDVFRRRAAASPPGKD